MWQYRNEGIDYVGESLFEQAEDGDDAYDWLPAVEEGRSFLAMNVEQQAEIAELIHGALQIGGGAQVERQDFVDAAVRAGEFPRGGTLSDEQFEIITDAAIYLRAGRTR